MHRRRLEPPQAADRDVCRRPDALRDEIRTTVTFMGRAQPLLTIIAVGTGPRDDRDSVRPAGRVRRSRPAGTITRCSTTLRAPLGSS